MGLQFLISIVNSSINVNTIGPKIDICISSLYIFEFKYCKTEFMDCKIYYLIVNEKKTFNCVQFMRLNHL